MATANYVLLEKVTVGAAGASSITFSGIPQTGYTDLVVKVSARNTYSAVSDWINVQFNSSTTGYSYRLLQGNGTTANSYSGSTQYSGDIDGATATASTFGSYEMYIPNYTSANNKSYSVDAVIETNGTYAESDLLAGLWSNSAAITGITFSPRNGSFVQYSTFYLYGVAKLGTTPAIVPYATGGDTIMTDGTYWYHAFKASGTFTPAKALSCDVLVVAGGGGGGGGGSGGGGGAGGIFYATSKSLSLAQTVTIGAGGASDTSGANSVFGSLTAAVGGGGGGSGVDGLAGGSGGGAYPAQIGGATTQTSTGGTGYGNAGGAGGAFTLPYSSGGGGGAGAAGTAGNSGASQSGAGGAGLNTWSSWASITATGASGYFAGGGGGGANAQYGGSNGAGGAGGGGAGANPGTAGTANTGGGGGGSQKQPSGTGTGGAGGSGIVIVRYAV